MYVISCKVSAPHRVCEDVFEQQYTSSMKVGSGGNLDLSREYPRNNLGLCSIYSEIVL